MWCYGFLHQIIAEKTTYLQTRRAVLATMDELRRAHQTGKVKIAAREVRWLDTLLESETEFIAEMLAALEPGVFLPEEYGMQVGK